MSHQPEKRIFKRPGAAAARIVVPDQPDDQVHEIDYVRWLSQMQADLAETLGGVMLRGCRPVPIGTAPGGSRQPLSSPGRLLGWSLHETSGAFGSLMRLWDGRDTNGRLLAIINVGTGGIANGSFPDAGISVTDALFVEIVTGGNLSSAVEGVLYLGAAD